MTESSPTSKHLHRFAVIGGDLRMTHLCERLRREGCPVSVLGCGQACLSEADGSPPTSASPPLRVCSTLQSAAADADILILPLPASRDGDTVWCPREPNRVVSLSEIAALMTQEPHLRLFGGRIPPDLTAMI
jgi:hypothetical protein